MNLVLLQHSLFADAAFAERYGAGGLGLSNDAPAIAAALAARGEVVLRKGATFKLDTDVQVPDGALITIDGAVTGAGKLLPAGSVTVRGSGSVTSSVAGGYFIKAIAGEFRWSGVSIRAANGYGIGCVPSSDITLFRVTDSDLSGCVYGILRNPSTAKVSRAVISRNTFRDMTGDAIEWNIGPDDRALLIQENIVDGVDSSGTNSGIGIGVAGKSYITLAGPTEFLISGNIVSRARQGIHVEACKNFTIANNFVSDISDAYSASAAQTECGGIVVYGARDFTIRGNDVKLTGVGYGIAALGGVYANEYVSVCGAFGIAGNSIDNAGISANIGGSGAVNISGNVATSGSENAKIFVKGRSESFALTANSVFSLSGQNSVELLRDEFAAFSSAGSIALINGNTVSDSLGSANASVTGAAYSTLNASGNNFTVAA